MRKKRRDRGSLDCLSFAGLGSKLEAVNSTDYSRCGTSKCEYIELPLRIDNNEVMRQQIMMRHEKSARATGSRSSRKSSYAGKQNATKAVGNKPPPTERKNNDPREREIIGARSLRVPRRQGQREEMPCEIKGPSPSSSSQRSSRYPGKLMEEKGGEEAPFYRSFRGEESQATPTHEIDPMINFQSRLNYAGRLSPIEEASPDSERAVCVVQKKEGKKREKRRSREDGERKRKAREREKMREIEKPRPSRPYSH
ncbi:Uncharacterized protein DBV15_03140 [Temnothorax longispinosus]|uniref:Uncharacterized protein n=1 Tax=Temnothorax longispinosus TaxID=300112 RepID=A0A4S2KNB1_9HYME|nr:Uncharacterized protein DBV15_03140 [Temnothorax longispinosus]